MSSNLKSWIAAAIVSFIGMTLFGIAAVYAYAWSHASEPDAAHLGSAVFFFGLGIMLAAKR